MAKHIHIHLNTPKKTADRKAIDFQPKITAKGRNYVSTGKLRNNNSECEYEELSPTGARTGRFLWVAENGRAVGDEKVEDSEENDAYIKGHQDGIAGKRQDNAYHPGGSKKPSVTLKYAEGFKQGEKDRKNGKTKDAGQYSWVMTKNYRRSAPLIEADLLKMEREGWIAIGEKKEPDGSITYTFGYYK